MRTRRMTALLSALLLVSTAAVAATYPELAEQRAARRAPPTIGYGNAYGYGANAPAYPANGNSSLFMLPKGSNGLPDARQIRWSFGQVNAASDPFYVWGLRTQGMHVPWSTPMSSWTNAQSWDWWRRRAGDSGPPPPLW